jgi:surfactin synthase thioesterase subunit
MNELLFSEPAKHYLLSTDLPFETVLVTVSPSEVNVLTRYAAPNQPIETSIIAQTTTIDESQFSVMLKQMNRMTDMETMDEKALIKVFLNRLDNNLSLVEQRREADEEQMSLPVTTLRRSIEDLLSQVE